MVYAVLPCLDYCTPWTELNVAIATMLDQQTSPLERVETGRPDALHIRPVAVNVRAVVGEALLLELAGHHVLRVFGRERLEIRQPTGSGSFDTF